MFQDLIRSALRGASAAREEYRESRRRRHESPAFERAAASAESIRGWLSRPEGELLFHLAERVPEGHMIVEIGSFLGRSTAFIGLGATANVPVYAIDPHTGNPNWTEVHGIQSMDTSHAFMRNMTELGLDATVIPIVATSEEAAQTWREERPIGLLFIDSVHTSDAVRQDGSLWLPHLADDGVAVFDDWTNSGVWDGITRLRGEELLPHRCHGFVGKDLVFGPDDLALPVSLSLLNRSHSLKLQTN